MIVRAARGRSDRPLRCRFGLRVVLLAVGIEALTGVPSAARAGEAIVARLEYVVDDPSGACASEAEFRRRIATRLGYDPFDAHATWIFRVRVDGRSKRPHAEIMTERDGAPAGKRGLDEATCDALSETLAATVAIAIDPIGVSQESSRTSPEDALPPLPPPPRAPASAIEPPAPPPPTPQRPLADPRRVVPFLYLDGTVTIGRTAGVALGGRGGVGVEYGALSVAGEARGEATPDAVALTSLDSVYWSVLSGALVACGHKGLFELCGVGALGSLQAKARDVARPSLKGTLFASLGARVGIQMPLTADVALRGNAELGIPLVRTTFSIDEQPAWTAPAVNGTFAIGVVTRFR